MLTNIAQKQYILSSCKLLLHNMNEYIVADNYLYVDGKLDMCECRTADGKKVVILGNAYCTDIDGKKPQDDISAFMGENIQKATRFWTGRWTIITEDELINDAAGLMCAFYNTNGGKWCVSSSLALIAHVLEKSSNSVIKSTGINWQILPDSIIADVKSLICTQKIRFSSEKLDVLPQIWISDYSKISTEEKCRKLAEMLVNAAKNIHTYSEKKILLALTGGKDSRLTFSAFIKSKVPFSCYTAAHENISFSDQSVPRKLSKNFGIGYSYIKDNPLDKEMLNDYYHFCSGNSNGVDARFYACNQFSKFDKETVIIRSGLFEAGQTYARSYTASDLKGFVNGMLAYYSDLRNSAKQKKAFDEWINYVLKNPIDYIDIRDRFYVEQRVGGWASAIEQSLDINDFVSIQIANCAELLSVLLSCNDVERKNLALTYKTIEMLEPRTLDIPVNQRGILDMVLRFRNVAKNPVQKLKNCLNKVRR